MMQQSWSNSFSTTKNASTTSIQKITFDEDLKQEVVSVVVTLCSGSSYDNLFVAVAQKPPTGRVAVYAVDSSFTPELFKALKEGESDDNVVQELLNDMKPLSPDCIVFNWECCSGCSSQTFHSQTTTMELVKYLLDKGNMVMFGDFSAKALINQWDSNLLGPNPFIKLGETSEKIKLNFKPEKLKGCPSKQLEMVGKLNQSGECIIHALGGTIVFGVDGKNSDNDVYDLEILTLATCSLNNSVSHNTVGHAMLKYKSGGIMLVSAGHWIELNQLEVNEDTMEQVSMEFGNLYKTEFESIKKSSVSKEMKQQQYNSMASQWVQRNAPSNYMSFSSTNPTKKK